MKSPKRLEKERDQEQRDRKLPRAKVVRRRRFLFKREQERAEQRAGLRSYPEEIKEPQPAPVRTRGVGSATQTDLRPQLVADLPKQPVAPSSDPKPNEQPQAEQPGDPATPEKEQ